VEGRFQCEHAVEPLSDLRVKFLYDGAAELGEFPDEEEVEELEEYASLRKGKQRRESRKTCASNQSGTRNFYVEGLNGGPATFIVGWYYVD